MKSKNGWVLLIMLLSGIVLGGFIGMLTANVSGLSWLNYGQSFGLESPVVLDLGLLVLTFGILVGVYFIESGISMIVMAQDITRDEE